MYMDNQEIDEIKVGRMHADNYQKVMKYVKIMNLNDQNEVMTKCKLNMRKLFKL